MSNSNGSNSKTWIILGILVVGIIWGIGPFKNAKYEKEKKKSYQPSFTGNYTESEINKLKENVKTCEYEVSNLSSKVHSHENMVSNASSRTYANELKDLEKVKSEYNEAVSRLNDAITKLNNAQ